MTQNKPFLLPERGQGGGKAGGQGKRDFFLLSLLACLFYFLLCGKRGQGWGGCGELRGSSFLNGRVEQGMKKNEGGGKEKKGALGVFFSFVLSASSFLFFRASFFPRPSPRLQMPPLLYPSGETGASLKGRKILIMRTEDFLFLHLLSFLFSFSIQTHLLLSLFAPPRRKQQEVPNNNNNNQQRDEDDDGDDSGGSGGFEALAAAALADRERSLGPARGGRQEQQPLQPLEEPGSPGAVAPIPKHKKMWLARAQAEEDEARAARAKAEEAERAAAAAAKEEEGGAKMEVDGAPAAPPAAAAPPVAPAPAAAAVYATSLSPVRVSLTAAGVQDGGGVKLSLSLFQGSGGA